MLKALATSVKPMFLKKFYLLKSLCILLLGTSLCACTQLSYYGQAISGHLSLLQKRENIDHLLSQENTQPLSPELREKLLLVKEVRKFAKAEIALPSEKAYVDYADIGRESVVYNVFAAPKLSLAAYQWCYLIIGCQSYRGYYAKEDAIRESQQLSDQGFDVHVGGSAAYSTLGYFRDPVLNTFIYRSDAELAATLFHELAHHILYIKNDTAFNESFASAVGNAALERWLNHKNDLEQYKTYQYSQARTNAFLSILKDLRKELSELYAQEANDQIKAQQKTKLWENAKFKYAAFKQSWGNFNGYDSWFKGDLNNAKLVTIGSYHKHEPAFASMLKNEQGDFLKFYEKVKRLSEKDKSERDVFLELQITNTKISLKN